MSNARAGGYGRPLLALDAQTVCVPWVRETRNDEPTKILLYPRNYIKNARQMYADGLHD